MLRIENPNSLRNTQIMDTPYYVGQVDETKTQYHIHCVTNRGIGGIRVNLERKDVNKEYEMWLWGKDGNVKRMFMPKLALEKKEVVVAAIWNLLK